jgi:hypothetical protein
MRWWMVLVALTTMARADDFPSVMDKPWSASTGYGPGFVRARSENPKVLPTLAVDLAIRRRLRPDLEVSLGLGGQFAKYGFGGIFADLRYRISAERPWNPFLFGGLGAGGGAGSDGPGLLLRAGVGIERRLEKWAFAADFAISRSSGDDMVIVRSDGTEIGHFGAFGVGLSLSATYYWGRTRTRRRFVP